jgi:hypothetical protein
MTEYLTERSIELRVQGDSPSLFGDISAAVDAQLLPGEVPIRFAVTESSGDVWHCELGVKVGKASSDSIFGFHKRPRKDAADFSVLMLVPTGIGAEVGGHAGDASPAAALLASVCDTLITHPNVLNASDIIQVPDNALYVEGSLITQLMMGTIGLRRVRSNRLLVLVQAHEDEIFTGAAINSVNAARATYGLDARVVELDPRFRMFSQYTNGGVAAGRVEGLEYLYDALDARVEECDAVAITSVIHLPPELHENYYRLGGEVVNPWGGVEAILTHAVSLRYGIPSAHAPMLESRTVLETDFGIVDPRMAAEVISMAFLQCVLRGLQRSPAVVPLEQHAGVGLDSGDVSCLVIPDGCVGLPTLAALFSGIPVVAVRGNSNLMKNELESLPWHNGCFFRVENYLEAAGTVAALRAGLSPWSTIRPLEAVPVDRALGSDGSNQLLLRPTHFGEVDGSHA